ncbi:MAG TPA: hypothetical protein VFB68_09310 [Xanthobacteraceae bacterium]|nr:hypothetical protein [Xanthobacteraceae bacterium]
MSPELKAAVENAYRVFGRYPLGRPIDVCDQCYPDLPAVFAKRPLREIDAHLLSQYVDARACHGYAEPMDGDMRYLLPRWLELIAAGDCIGRFGDDDGLVVVMPAQWRSRWPADEIAALDVYFAALFRDAMLVPVEIRNDLPVPRVLGRSLWWFLWSIGAAGSGAVLPLLRIAEDLPGRDMDIRIAGLARTIAEDAVDAWSPSPELPPPAPFDADLAVLVTDEELGAQCQCERCQQKVAAWEWLAKPALRERLETAVFEETDPHAASLLSMGEQLIAALIRNRAARQPR